MLCGGCSIEEVEIWKFVVKKRDCDVCPGWDFTQNIPEDKLVGSQTKLR